MRILLSPTDVKVRQYCFFGQVFEIEVLMHLHVMRSPESENHVFRVYSVCVYIEMLAT